MNNLTKFLVLALVLAETVNGQGNACNKGDGFGVLIQNRRHKQTLVNHTFIATDLNITCVGKIQRWEFYARDCDVIRFQVWRPKQDGDYFLVGENVWDATRCFTMGWAVQYNVTVEDIDQIPVRAGDRLGWYIETNFGSIIYDKGLPGSNAFGQILSNSSRCDPTVSQSCSFSPLERRAYSIRALLDQDRPPSFTNLPPTMRPEISEDSAVGTPVFTVHATPRLTWGPSVPHVVSYRITPGSYCEDMFKLNMTIGVLTFNGTDKKSRFITGRATPRICNLTIEAAIDGRWQRNASLEVNVTAANTAHVIRATSLPAIVNLDSATTGTGPVRVRVVDVDDDLDEQQPLSDVTQKRFQIIRADPDASIFTTRADPADRNKGIIGCTKDLRFREGPTHYMLEVTAADDVYADGPRTLRVDVINPRRPPHLVSPPGRIWLNETVTGPLRISNISFDKDNVSDSEGAYQLTLTQYPKNEKLLFRIRNESTIYYIELMAGNEFDCLRTHKYQVEITVTDTRMKYKDRANLTVEIIPVNQEPVFTVKSPVSVDIPEEMAVHSAVPGLNLTVYDRDTVFGDTFSLRIQDGTGNEFFYTKVGSTQLYINQRIDIDPNTPRVTMNFEVRVFDQAGTSNTSHGVVRVVINVYDINDNAPVYQNKYHYGSIVENTRAPYIIGRFVASDRDWGQNAAITYWIQNEASVARGDYYFQVNRTTGQLSLKHPLDYEEHQNISFKLVATDGGSPPLSGHMHVFMSVTDVNDNRPTFTRRLYDIELPSYVPTHTHVTTILAVDPDTEDVSRVTYHLLRATSNFRLNVNEGHVTTAARLSSGVTYLLYCYSFSSTQGSVEHISDPSVVRIDAFDGPSHLVDVTLNLPLKDFNAAMETEFIKRLETLFRPWIIKVLRKLASYGQTVVTLYSVENTIPDSYDSVNQNKHVVHKDVLLSRMRADIDGTPSDVLRGQEFAKFRVIHVSPTHYFWLTETTGGIATLSIIIITCSALLIGGIVLTLKKFNVGPFQESSGIPTPRRGHKVTPYHEEFQLNYKGQSKLRSSSVQAESKSVLPPRNIGKPRPPPPSNADV